MLLTEDMLLVSGFCICNTCILIVIWDGVLIDELSIANMLSGMAWDNFQIWLRFSVRNFQASFNYWWPWYFLWSYPQMNVIEPLWSYVNIDSGAWRQQAIIWANVDIVSIRHMASLDQNELIIASCMPASPTHTII